MLTRIKDPLFTNTLKYGLIAGILIFVIKLLLYFVGDINNEMAFAISIAIWIGAMYLATKKYREEKNIARLEFGHALGACVLTVVFASIAISVLLFILASIDSGYGDAVLLDVKTTNEITGKSEMLEQSLSMYETIIKNPGYFAALNFFSNVFYGTLGSLIIAFILKKSGDSLRKID